MSDPNRFRLMFENAANNTRLDMHPVYGPLRLNGTMLRNINGVRVASLSYDNSHRWLDRADGYYYPTLRITPFDDRQAAEGEVLEPLKLTLQLTTEEKTSHGGIQWAEYIELDHAQLFLPYQAAAFATFDYGVPQERKPAWVTAPADGAPVHRCAEILIYG